MARNRTCSAQTLLLLNALLEDRLSWQHGYGLSKETQLRSGTLYPILMRLCDRGWLESKWQQPEEAGRPPRHLYRLTAKGAAYALEQIARHDSARGQTPRGSVA